jgi:hypothetical protein
MQAHALIYMPRIIPYALGLQVLGFLGTPRLLFGLKPLFSYRNLMHKFVQLISNMYMYTKIQVKMAKTM